MAKLKDFDTTPANNNDTPPFGWPEGMAPSAVNNTARQLYASLREWYEDAQWIELGHAVTSASGADIVFTGDVSSSYTVGQAVRSDGSYGWITNVAFVTNTTVTVSGITFAGAPTLFEVAAVQADNALPYGGVVTTGDTAAQTIASDLNMQALGATTGTFSGAVSMTDLTATTGTFSGVVDFPDGSASAPSITNTGDTNTGLFFPAADTVAIATAGSEALLVDSSGNLGLGVTPSAWQSTRDAFQFGLCGAVYSGNAANFTAYTHNAYVNSSGNSIYLQTGAAANITMDNGGNIEFYNAPSGTAGNAVTFTQAMTLTNGGNLLVGTTTDSGSRVSATRADTGALFRGVGASSAFELQSLTNQVALFSLQTGDDLLFGTNSTERARITSGGNLLVGTTSDPGYKLNIAGTGTGQVIHADVAADFNGSANGNHSRLYVSSSNNTNSYSVLEFASRTTVWRNAAVALNGNDLAFLIPSASNVQPVLADERARFTSGGSLLVGTTIDVGDAISAQGDVRLRSGGVLYLNNPTDGANANIKVDSGSHLIFSRSGEKARIGNNGYFKASNDGTYFSATGSYHELNSNQTGQPFAVFSHTHATNPFGLIVDYVNASPDNNTNEFLRCRDSTTSRCIIWSDGDVVNHDGTYGTISDETLKSNIVDANSQWDDFKAFRFRNFQFNSDIEQYGQDAPTLLGVIAQELEQVSPGLVKENGEGIKQVKQSILYMKAMKVIQELQTRVEQLEAHH